MRRVLTITCTALYCFALIGLLGGIGVMASGASYPAPKGEGGVGFALILLLNN